MLVSTNRCLSYPVPPSMLDSPRVGKLRKTGTCRREGWGLTVITSDAKDADAVCGLVPDEVVVRDRNDRFAKLEVETALGVADGAGNFVQIVTRSRGLGFGKGGHDLVENCAREGADGVAAVEQDGLPVGLIEDVDKRAVGLRNGDAVEIDPVAGHAVGRLVGGNDGTLLERAREFLGVEAAEDDGAALAF